MERLMNNRHAAHSRSVNSERARNMNADNMLMQKIQETDFALYDTVLFLDAYPYSEEALAHYHSLLNTRRLLVSEYEKNSGPLTSYGNESTTEWAWTKTPLPWEI